MGLTKRAVVVLTTCATLALATVSWRDWSDSTLALSVAFVYAVAWVVPRDGTEHVVVAGGFALWLAAYACWATAALDGNGSWPPFHGAFWLAYEIVVACTDWLEDGDDGRTLRTNAKNRAGFGLFATLDALLTVVQIWYGSGAQTCEFGLLPTRTVEERTATFILYFTLHMGLFAWVGLAFRRAGRRVKYLGAALHFAAHAGVLRSPGYAPGNLVGLGVRLSTLANTAWTARVGRQEMPEPKPAFVFLTMAMPVWCVVSTALSVYVRNETARNYAIMAAEWTLFWTVVALCAPAAKRTAP